MPSKLCKADGCPKTLPKGQRKYCSSTCQQRMAKRRYRERHAKHASHLYPNAKPTEVDKPTARFPEESTDGRGRARRGPGYPPFCRSGYPERIAAAEISQRQAAQELGEEEATVSRWMTAWIEDSYKGRLAEEHEADLSHTEDLGSFTRRYFPKLLVPDFHLEWEEAIDTTVGTGERLLLLAPQRFGKSEMLIRYCMKRIALDPNICIGWVSKTQGLAERMVGYIRQNLEHNSKFVEDVLGPGQTFVPPNRSGLSWTNGEFTVANRTEIRKSPTVAAIGVGGTIVGQDFDLIILDDPQDRARCMSPSQRDKDAEWLFTDFLSRKEEHTGVAFIMSRQHMEDLPGLIMRDHIDDWEVRIYRAHDPACTIPERQVEDHVDCVLWPKKRSWRWLYHQKQANVAHFQRNYMNDPKTDATTYISAADLDDVKDHTRRVGDIPSGSRLIAGIDPAEAKPVAAVLWGYDGIHRHVIDCIEAPASVVGLRHILQEWPARYGVREFVFEKNMAKSWLVDTEVKALIDRQRLHIRQHYTSATNKNSNAIGPVAMFQRMRTEPPTITVPWGAGEGRERIERLLRSWLTFDPDWAGHKHADDDLTMASWFPMPVIDTWERPAGSSMYVEYDTVSNPLGGF